MLVGVEIHRLGDDPKLHGFEVAWTFRDDYDVGTVLTAQGFAESAGRQQLVIDDESMVI